MYPGPEGPPGPTGPEGPPGPSGPAPSGTGFVTVSGGTLADPAIPAGDGISIGSAVEAVVDPAGGLTLSPAGISGANIIAYAESLAYNISSKAPALVATVAQLDPNTATATVLTASAPGAIGLIDGQAVAVGDRILVKNESAAANNGLYEVTDAGDPLSPWVLTRTSDANSAPELCGALVPVETGSIAGTVWLFSADPGSFTLGMTAVVWTQLSVPAATTTTSGIVQLTGDIGGVFNSVTVTGLQGNSVATGAPAGGQVLTWNAGTSKWEPATPSAGGSPTLTVAGTFTVGSAVYEKTDGTWAYAQANSGATLGLGIVVATAGGNSTVQFSGPVTFTSAGTYAKGNYYFVSDATPGLLTSTEPTASTSYSNPLLFATTDTAAGVTSGIVLPFRPSANGPTIVWPGTGAQLTAGDGTAVDVGPGVTLSSGILKGTSAIAVTQVAHGFSVQQAIYFDGTNWQKAQSNAAATLGLAIVSAVTGANTFVAQFSGSISGLAGLSAGQYYFVSDATAGALTTTEPTSSTSYSNPVLLATSTTAGIVLPYRPSAVNGSVPYAGPVNGGRLTLTSGTPVTTSDVTGATTIYWAPYQHGAITLWDGSNVQTIVSAEVSVALGTLTSGTNYDVFGYYSAGALALEVGPAWTSDTARATALAWANGLLCKSGDATRRYLGTFRTTSTTATADSGGGEDTVGTRYLFNADNRVERPLRISTATTSWSYTTVAWRASNGSSSLRMDYVDGLGADLVNAYGASMVSSSSSGPAVAAGVGVDSTSANSAQVAGTALYYVSGISGAQQVATRYAGTPGLGKHSLYWLEYGGTSATFYGKPTGPYALGLVATVRA